MSQSHTLGMKPKPRRSVPTSTKIIADLKREHSISGTVFVTNITITLAEVGV